MTSTAASGSWLTEEHVPLRDTVERFARRKVALVIADYHQRKAFPYTLVARMGELDLFGLPFPEEYGGMGGDFSLCVWRSRSWPGWTRRLPSRSRRG